MKYIAGYVILMMAFVTTLSAQSNKPSPSPLLTGQITDKESGQPVSFASVILYSLPGHQKVKTGTTDNKGAFSMRLPAPGYYQLTVEFVGYESAATDSIHITATHAVNLGTLSITKQVAALQGITVVATKPLVENKIDKVVYNAEKDVTSHGGAAIDVLKKVPQVTVDINGNVELQGNPNVRFLINGKPSSVFGNSLSDALAAIPASQIKSIEAITSPGARYDAQGTGGIINIVLKDNKMQGINGSINFSAGTRLENGSVNLNLRKNNFGVNAYFSGNAQLSSRTPAVQNRQSNDTAAKTHTSLVQDGYSDFTRNGYQSGVGFDWSPGKKDNITGSFGYSHFGSHSTGVTLQQQLTQDAANNPVITLNTIRNAWNKSDIHSFDWSLDYKRKFAKPGQELEVLYSASFGSPHNNYQQTQTYQGQTSPYNGLLSYNPGTDRETNLSVDYTHPLTENITLETGVKTVLQRIYSDVAVNTFNTSAHDFVIDPAQSYQLRYNMNVYAGYVSASFPLFNYLKVKAGARFEHTNVAIDYPNTSIPSYNTLVPTIVLSHNISQQQFIKLSYSRRIERPEYKELNPFLNISDPYNITTGNPLLRPEIGNALELGYNTTLKGGGNIYVALTERINTNDLKIYTLFYPEYQAGDSTYNNVSVTNRLNVGTEYNTGITFSGSVPVTKRLNIRANAMAIQKRVVNNLFNGGAANGMSYRFNINTSYALPEDLILEAFGNYNSSLNTIQGKRPQSLTYTFAFRKQFWNKNASIGITATNPFTRYVNQLTTVVSNNYISYNTVKVPYRSFGVSFTYKFGKLEFKKGKDEDNYMHNMPSY